MATLFKNHMHPYISSSGALATWAGFLFLDLFLWRLVPRQVAVKYKYYTMKCHLQHYDIITVHFMSNNVATVFSVAMSSSLLIFFS